MSSLEERREARRRRRQQQEEAEDDLDLVNGGSGRDLEERIARRRREREERFKRMAAGLTAINGEDEIERRRRERREQRLKQEIKSSGVAAEEETSTRRSRRRGTEEDIATEESSYTSTRSRRRRGGDEEETDSAPAAVDSTDNAEAERAAQEAAEAEERRRQEEAAERRRREEEEDNRRAEEEERRREEAERRRRQEDFEEELERQRLERDAHEQRINEQILKLQNEQNEVTVDLGLYIDEKTIIDNNHIDAMERERKRSEDSKTSKLKTFFEDRMEDCKINGHHSADIQRRDSWNKKSLSSTSSIEETPSNPIQERLHKYETSLQNDAQKDIPIKQKQTYEVKLLSPGADHLKNIQRRFEGERSDFELNSSRLGRLSASESHINETTDFSKSGGRKLSDRWPTDVHKSPIQNTFKASSASSMQSKTESPTIKSGKITLLSSKFNKSIDSASVPGKLSSFSPLKRQMSETSSVEVRAMPARTVMSPRGSVTDRWQFDQKDRDMPPVVPRKSRPLSASPDTKDKADDNIVSSSITVTTNGWKKQHSVDREEEERAERERLEKEEAEREALERERMEREEAEREALERAQREKEEAEREAARMAEEQARKKKSKRKGLGGLDPEKKKKLKDTDSECESDESNTDGIDNSRESSNVSMESRPSRVAPLPADMNGMSKAELIKLCKSLHDVVAKLEEELYDTEQKIRKQDYDINALTLKINDAKGKFIKPVLRKVNKESKFDKLAKSKADFRENLKHVDKSSKQPNWRENLKKTGEEQNSSEDIEENVTFTLG